MKRGLRVLAIAVAVALALVATPALADESPTYLAMGDSVPFGFSPFVSPSDADGFVGYPEDLASVRDVGVRNAACPGETSGSLISTSAPDNGCQFFRSIGDLHVNYKGSQLSYAVAFLRAHKHTSLVTMTIGANDFFLLQKACVAKGGDVLLCIESGLAAVLGTLQANLSKIYRMIRGTGYQGRIVALTYYVTNFKDPVAVFVISSLNAVVSAVTVGFGGRVADGFHAFGAIALSVAGGDSCAAGLLIKKPDGTCDIHPSAFGAEVLAQAVQAAL
jgi:lysophospholipase L1-like esterase